ncbi:hypothetical protein BDV06DRAFT_223671 [Aspergillus oleicola]
MGPLVFDHVSQSPSNTRECLLRSLKGNTFLFPDLHKILAHWPQDTHPEVDRLSKQVEKKLQIFAFKVLSEQENQPQNSLFAWDDQSDSNEISDIVTHNDRGALFRRQTKEFIHASLSSNESQPLPEQNNPFI